MKPWFSDVLAFRRDPLDFLLAKGTSASEPLVPLALGLKKIYLVADPDLVKPILKADEADLDKGRLVHKLETVVGRSSVTLSGDEHRQRREALGAQLGRGFVERLIPMMAAEIRRFVAQVAREPTVDVHTVTPVLALKLIGVALFGHNVLAPEDENALIMAIRSVEDELADDMFRALPLTPWAALARRQRRDVARKAMSIVVNHVRAKASDTSVLKDLDRLGLDDNEMRDEIVTMLLVGHHTTGSAAAWMLYHLVNEPGLMAAVAAEAAEISDTTGELRPERIKSASLSMTLVREVLRLYPSAWWFSREVRRRIELGGRTLTPGTSLIVSPWQMHRDARYWDDPDTFRLDRAYTSRAYIPFGAGPRACIGLGVAQLELQLLALEIAAAYQCDGLTVAADLKPRPSLTLLPPPISVTFQPRDWAVPIRHSAA